MSEEILRGVVEVFGDTYNRKAKHCRSLVPASMAHEPQHRGYRTTHILRASATTCEEEIHTRLQRDIMKKFGHVTIKVYLYFFKSLFVVVFF